jgi:hypothetical protein
MLVELDFMERVVFFGLISPASLLVATEAA